MWKPILSSFFSIGKMTYSCSKMAVVSLETGDLHWKYEQRMLVNRNEMINWLLMTISCQLTVVLRGRTVWTRCWFRFRYNHRIICRILFTTRANSSGNDVRTILILSARLVRVWFWSFNRVHISTTASVQINVFGLIRLFLFLYIFISLFWLCVHLLLSFPIIVLFEILDGGVGDS